MEQSGKQFAAIAACNTRFERLEKFPEYWVIHCRTCNYRSALAKSAREAHELFIADRPRCERSSANPDVPVTLRVAPKP